MLKCCEVDVTQVNQNGKTLEDVASFACLSLLQSLGRKTSCLVVIPPVTLTYNDNHIVEITYIEELQGSHILEKP